VGESISSLGEKELIRRLFQPAFTGAFRLEVPIGDDAAVVALPSGRSLVATIDKIPERLIAHQLGLVTYEHLGRYLVAANLSDLAAMGADPLGILLSFCLPSSFGLKDVEDLTLGISSTCARYEVPVLGGDTGGGSAPSLVAAALGTLPSGTALRRDGACPGDVLYSTGTPGTFGVALAYYLVARNEGLILETTDERLLLARFRAAEPQLLAGRMLRDSGVVRACQDISDGVGQTALELATNSGCAVELDIALLSQAGPTFASKVAEACECPIERLLLGPGADFELMFAARPDDAASIESLFAEANIRISPIGRFVDGSGGFGRYSNGEIRPLPEIGWKHFTGKSDLDSIRSTYQSSPQT
jgi:thiamine-monophosphate kinase